MTHAVHVFRDDFDVYLVQREYIFFLAQLAVLIVAVAAVSAGVYPVKTGGGKGTSGHSKGGAHENAAEDDRFHMQSDDGQYVFGHTTGTQVRKEIDNDPRELRIAVAD